MSTDMNVHNSEDEISTQKNIKRSNLFLCQRKCSCLNKEREEYDSKTI